MEHRDRLTLVWTAVCFKVGIWSEFIYFLFFPLWLFVSSLIILMEFTILRSRKVTFFQLRVWFSSSHYIIHKLYINTWLYTGSNLLNVWVCLSVFYQRIVFVFVQPLEAHRISNILVSFLFTFRLVCIFSSCSHSRCLVCVIGMHYLYNLCVQSMFIMHFVVKVNKNIVIGSILAMFFNVATFSPRYVKGPTFTPEKRH